jgi:predicted metal-binding membrane protein
VITAGSRARPRLSLSALLLLGAAGWIGVVALSRSMAVMPGTMGLGLVSFLGVWTLMMAAMMLPSVIPFAMLYTRTIVDERGPRLAAYALGYLLVWAAAGIPAYGLAWLAGRPVDNDQTVATCVAVAIFAACGIYQLTPAKDRCLARCRSPLGFVVRYSTFRGVTRDLRVGLHHGAYCLACCWSLMALLVAFGLMNVTAMIGLAGVVLAEKVLRHGRDVARLVGVVALVLAALVIWMPALAPSLEAGTHMGGM